MIARTWRGSVLAHDSQTYVDYLQRTGFAALGSTPGNLAVFGLRRHAGERSEFVLISLWDSQEAVRRFAGDHPERAVFFPEDEHYLIERDNHADHFEVVHVSGPGANSAPPGLKGFLGWLAEWWLGLGVTASGIRHQALGGVTPRGFTYVRLP
jgi:heme-degrading monooxygenase HmoA